MMKSYFSKAVIAALIMLLNVHLLPAQDLSGNLWTQQPSLRRAERTWYPHSYQSFSLQTDEMRNFLSAAPFEKSPANHSSSFIIELPMPDGSFHRYSLVESPVMEPQLAAKYPFIKTYAGQGINDPTATIRCDMTLFGFHAYVLSAGGTIYIDPVSLSDTRNYIIYYKHDIPPELFNFSCATETADSRRKDDVHKLPSTAVLDNQLRTYRLALAADYEYTAHFGGTISGALSAMTTTLNRVNGVYENELDIHLILIANDTLLIYTTPADPYTNSSGSTMLYENDSNLSAVIGNANYDIGHVFSTGGGGIAGIGVACTDTIKAQGVTGLSNPSGDPFDIDYVAHEIGHQVGATHPFNSEIGNCRGNRYAPSAYEPGSGSTIMAYAGICDSDNLQPHTDAYFHSVSFDQIITYTQTGVGRVCPLATPSGNLSPTVVIPLSYTIPVNTPFRLIATGSDPDGESITYCWEEWDIAGIFSSGQTWDTQIPGVNAPIFRSFYPTATGTRLFPKLNDILGDSVTIGEIKAIYSRTLHFRCTVRDNHSGCGGVTHSVGTTTVIVDASGGTGFAITNPNKAGLVWAKNKMHTVVWNVSGSNTPNVNIYLSTDDGYSFTDTIAMHVPNTGSYYFAFPDWIINSPDTTQLNKVRLMVEGDGNIFFDINDHAFRIDTFDILEPLDTVTIIKLYNSLVIKDSYSGLYNIHFGLLSPINGYFTVSIFDIMGKLMKQIIFKKRAEVYEEYIDVSDLASGMYIIRFDLPDGVETRKFMKAKY